ncbi:unnamed protein product [Xylocopa violacea]|uniref:Ankyrin repeat domain-containing protein 54 n=1 Tax=Xylocopa violacea TaxID=135666 RepID=A0ABP1P919_XYLVO
MTSADSGTEIDNNSIAQKEDVSTEEINNVSLALATITSRNHDIRNIEPNTLRIELASGRTVCWPGIPISSLGSVNENYKYSDFENCIPTSSSGPILVSSNVFHIKSPCVHNDSKLSPYSRDAIVQRRFNLRRMKFIDACKNDHLIHDIHTRLMERRMRSAAATNDTSKMAFLLNCGTSPNNCDERGRTPLHIACCGVYPEIVRLLLKHGADPNIRDCEGNTPLHFAVVKSNVVVVTLLLNAGTDPLCLDQDGYTPLQIAQTKLWLIQNYNLDMIKIKKELQYIVSIMLAHLKTHKDAYNNMETLSTYCSRLSLSCTSDQVQDDAKDLLTNLDALSITQ